MRLATVLADSLVEAGILSRSPHDSPLYQLRYEGTKWLHVEQIITDWRVAGKVLESIKGIHMPCGFQRMIFDGITPRAIIEAWYEVTQHEPS